MRAPLGWSPARGLQAAAAAPTGSPVGALRRLRRVPVRLVAVVLPAALLTPAAPASAAAACGTAGRLMRTPATSAHLASGVRVRGWNGTDAQGHPVRLTVAETDLARVRLVAASARSYGDVAATTSLTGAVHRAVVGINGDYFSYDWSGDAVPDGPLVVGGRILRLPPGAHSAVGIDAGGRPFADSVRPTGRLRQRRPRPRPP
jgi:hypothetical protein